MVLLLDLEKNNKNMKNIRIDEVGDINSNYPYLEIFYLDNDNPFLEVSISENLELIFKFYPSDINIQLHLEDWERILFISKDFLPKALKNENDFSNFFD
jgi:hypothetical protein